MQEPRRGSGSSGAPWGSEGFLRGSGGALRGSDRSVAGLRRGSGGKSEWGSGGAPRGIRTSAFTIYFKYHMSWRAGILGMLSSVWNAERTHFFEMGTFGNFDEFCLVCTQAMLGPYV